MNKIILFLIIIIIGSALSSELQQANPISKNDFDCTLRAINVCGNDDSEETNKCLKHFVKKCQRNPGIADDSIIQNSSHHSYKTSIIVKDPNNQSFDNTSAKRICITDTNCNCKTIAKNKCINDADFNTCVTKTKQSCQERCQSSRRCYRLDCKNAGKSRCTENAEVECAIKFPNSLADSDACIAKRTKSCLRYEKATCRKAIRVYKFRKVCKTETKEKCGAILDKKTKCACVKQTRHTCLVRKVKHHKETVRRVFDCYESAKIICSEKRCGHARKQCIKKERSICEPPCQRESRKLCSNQTNGPCYNQEYKTCVIKWKRTFCKKRAHIRCGDDKKCLKIRLAECKHEVPACFADGASCNDNNKCTKDVCDPLQGCINTPINCDDNNACTTESCDPVLGCVYTNQKCDDGVLCTRDSCNTATGECKFVFDRTLSKTCAGGSCVIDSDCYAWEKSQNLKSTCQKAFCNLQTGSCVAVSKKHCAQECKKTCVPNDACDTATCQLDKTTDEYNCVHTTKDCDDGKSCTLDTCDSTVGCVHKVNTDICPPNPTCETTLDCQEWATTKNLDNKCQKAICDVQKGICVAKITSSTECDQEVCEKHCQPSNSCEFTKCINNGEKSICRKTPVICDDKKACTVDSCDTTLGCVFKYVVSDLCKTGAQCSKTSDCKDYQDRENLEAQCLKAVCDPVLGACVKVPIDKTCKHKRRDCKIDCVKNDACDVAQCVADESGDNLTCQHIQKSCDDGIQCTVDSCDTVLGCVNTYKADDINCPKEGQCSRDSDCLQWGFTQKLSKQCLKAVCDKTLGACKSVPKEKQCTTSDDCNATCQPANPCETASCKLNPNGNYVCQRVTRNCDDSDKCTLDTCNIANGKCLHTPISSPECSTIITNKCTVKSDCAAWGVSQKLGKCQVAVCDKTTFTCVSKKSKKASCNTTQCPNCVARNLCEKAKCVQDTTGAFNCVYKQKSCDDGKLCTVDRCDLNVGCVNTYVPSSKCPKGLFCKTNDNCVNYAIRHNLQDKCKIAVCDQTLGRCVSQKSNDKTCVLSTDCVNCKPKNACEIAKCTKNNDGSVSCVRVQNKCDDGKVCTVDSCDGTTGKCVNTYTVSAQCPPTGQCQKNIDCKQWALTNNVDTACLTPICDSKTGSCSTIPNGYKCSKKTCKKACQPSDACQQSSCSYDTNTKKLACEYTRKVCNDNNKCTVDSCDTTLGCVFKFDKTIKGCDSKTPACKSKSDCVDWATKNNLSGNCQEAVCDSTTKTCKSILINNPQCNPWLKKCKKQCVAANACESASCLVDAVTKKFDCVKKALTCNDNNPCTTDVCDTVKGCINTYVTSQTCQQYCKLNSDCASYGVKKNASLKCKIPYCDTTTTSCKLKDDTSNTSCKPITTECNLICKAKNACDSVKCVRQPGTNKFDCVHKGITCNDGKSCTVDTCDSKKGCVYTFKKGPQCQQLCDKDLDCAAWGVSQKLEDKCQKAVCDAKLGSCKAVQGTITSKCTPPTNQCTFSKDCPQGKFGTVCCVKGLNKQCCDNECQTDLDCVPTDKKTQWGYCKSKNNGKKVCIIKKKCTVNTDCDDSNACTKDVCLSDYGFCKNIPRCIDNSQCTLDICTPGADGKSYTCKNPVRSCTNDKTLLDKNYDLLSNTQKTAWLGKCSHTTGCVSCVVNAQCDDNNGCTTDSCVNQFCVNAPIDNQWCDPVLSGQPITVEGYFPTFTRL
jgi:hypothetical protein